jgi:hypothetical protein
VTRFAARPQRLACHEHLRAQRPDPTSRPSQDSATPRFPTGLSYRHRGHAGRRGSRHRSGQKCDAAEPRQLPGSSGTGGAPDGPHVLKRRDALVEQEVRSIRHDGEEALSESGSAARPAIAQREQITQRSVDGHWRRYDAPAAAHARVSRRATFIARTSAMHRPHARVSTGSWLHTQTAGSSLASPNFFKGGPPWSGPSSSSGPSSPSSRSWSGGRGESRSHEGSTAARVGGATRLSPQAGMES